MKRLIGGRSLRDLRGVFNEGRVSEMRDAIEAADRMDREKTHEIAEFQEHVAERAEDVELSLEDVNQLVHDVRDGDE